MPKSRQHHAEEDLSPDAGTAPNVIKISSRLGSYDFGDRRLRLNQRLNPVFNPGNHVAKHHRFLVPSHSPPTLNGNSKSLSNPNTRGELRPSFCCVAFNRIRSAVCCQGDCRDVRSTLDPAREATRMFQTWRAFGWSY
jgi:hypothetical protein